MDNKCKTQILEGVIEQKQADNLYEYLRDNIKWEQGIPSKKGPTRLAKSIDLNDYPELNEIIQFVLRKISDKKYFIFGTYLNYYKDGKMWTPNHTHQKTHQLVISIGGTRKLTLGKKEIDMKNGDAAIFGSIVHGVPKDNNVVEGRISLATFMTPI